MLKAELPAGPYRLVTVNNAPARASRMVARLCYEMKDKYTITHAGNAERVEDVAELVKKHKPDILFCASMWSEAESAHIKQVARSIVPGVRTYAVPKGMQVEKGPEATIQHVISHLEEVINGDLGLQ